jgi:ABC-type Zn uptake system ZnuABC Zn-binding protein ZnuA
MDIQCEEEGICDPHVWMNPQNVMLWTLTIRDTLSERDPANAETYARNAEAYIAQLSELHSEIETLLESIPPQNRVLVTNHDSLGYFAAQYGFEVVGVVISGGSTVAEPSAQDIATLIEVIEAHRVQAVFAETTINPDIAQQVANESGAVLYTLYSGSLGDADGPASTYLDYMRYNTRTIVDGLD